jgi:pimeloyl-ACP methyl ester carboxylesterase
VVLVGNSVGCQVAVEAALRSPELVRALVLVGPTVDSHARSWTQQARRLLADAPREPWRYGAILVPDYLRAGPRRFVGTMGHALAHPVEERIAGVAVPVEVVRGEHDPIAPSRWIWELSRAAPLGRTVVVPGLRIPPSASVTGGRPGTGPAAGMPAR